MAASEDRPNRPLVVIAIDASAEAENAFKWYLEHVHGDQYRVLLVHAVEQPVMVGGDAADSVFAYEIGIQEAQESSKVLMDKYDQLLAELNITAKFSSAVHPRCGEYVCDIATKEGAAMIVTGSRGQGTIRRTIMGSTSDYILHHAVCPVVIIHEKNRAHSI